MENQSSAPKLPKINDTGITVLHDPEGAIADIVFVHGLQGHPWKTWTRSGVSEQEPKGSTGSHKETSSLGTVFSRIRSRSPSVEAQQKIYWPFDFLPGDCPNIRVFTFGYDSKVSRFFSGPANQSRITDHASNLLYALKAKRVDFQGRPLIFIAHSLGGIIVKDAICRAAGDTSTLLDIYSSTKTIFFFGTPHRGSSKASSGELARRIVSVLRFDSSRNIVNALEVDSSELERVHRAFMKIYEQDSRPIRVVTLQEAKGMVGINAFGLNDRIVGPESSTLTGAETIITIHGSHRDMCRFASKDEEGYQQVLGQVRDDLSAFQSVPGLHSVEVPIACSTSQVTRSSTFSLNDTERKCIALLTRNMASVTEYRASLPRRARGTCQWILSSPLYHDWNSDRTKCLLWISGYPGSGKTILSAYLVDHLSDGESSPIARKSGKMPCYFFCNENIESQRDGKAILRSLIHQLLLRHKRMVKHVKYAYEMYGSGFDSTFEALWRIFVDIASDKKTGPLVIIVDAIDECEEHTREKFLQRVTNLVEKRRLENRSKNGPRPPQIKFIITSRPLFGRGYASNLLQIDPSQPSVEADLRLLIRGRVEDIVQRFRCTPETRDHLETVLYSKADRTFLWVSLVLYLLERSFLAAPKNFARIIDEIPQTLTATYDRFLQGISDEYQTLASELLHMIVGSARPLTLDEMGALIVIQDDHRIVADVADEVQPNIRETLEGILGPLIRIWDSKINLVHQSLKEYLLSLSIRSDNSALSIKFGVNPLNANLLMARKCVSYLMLDDFAQDIFSEDPPSKEQSLVSSEEEVMERIESDDDLFNPFELEEVALLKDPETFEVERSTEVRCQYALFDYAALYWADHLLGCQSISTPGLGAQVLDLSDTTSSRGSNWFRYYWLHSSVDLPRPQDFVSLVTSCYFGYLEVVNRLQDTSKAASVERGLYWAARMGHHDIVERLLDDGVSPDVEVVNGETALHVATKFGHKEIVKILLRGDGYIPGKNIQRINYARLRGRTPLSIASGNGFKEVASLLLESPHIQPDLPDQDQWTPLFWSAGGKHLDILQMLITDTRLDVNHVDRAGRNVLSWAASMGNFEIVKYLVSLRQLKADARDRAGRTALSWAAGEGHLQTTELLRRSGRIDVSSKDNDGRSALSWACGEGHHEVVQYLLKHDPFRADDEDIDGWTPLSWALKNHAPRTVQVLLSSELVDINKKDQLGMTPFRYAVSYGYLDVVKLFLAEKGLDIETKDNYGHTPLWKARRLENADIIKLLEEASK